MVVASHASSLSLLLPPSRRICAPAPLVTLPASGSHAVAVADPSSDACIYLSTSWLLVKKCSMSPPAAPPSAPSSPAPAVPSGLDDNTTTSTTSTTTTNITTPSSIDTPSAPATTYRPKHTRASSSVSITSTSSLRPPLLPLETTTKLARNVSPALLARMKFLNQGSSDASTKNAVDVGRIEDDKIRKLDEFHRDRSWHIDRKGAAWSGVHGQPDTPAVSESPSTETPPLDIGHLPLGGETALSRHAPDTREVDVKSGPNIGRIDADTLRRLDESHKDLSLNVVRKGSAWSGTLTPSAGMATATATQTASRGPTTEPIIKSDHNNTVRASDNALPSKPDTDVAPDMQKNPGFPETEGLTLNASTPQTESHAPPSPSPQPSQPTPSSVPTPAPTPPPKDTPPIPPMDQASVLDNDNGIDIQAYFEKRHFSRANSIYTLSKASFTNQILQLTAMKLPPTTIASEITALPSSTLAGRALHKAGNDIRLWIAKTKEVLNGLDAEDDVEWAAAAGRDGLAEVDGAIGKFQGLVTVYITAIEDLQSRADIALLPAKDQATLISQMEDIVSNWSHIKQTLKGIKNQVEIAMEWEELWNNVLGEIGLEIENLSRLVFEMEERRHRVISDSVAEASEKFDIADLETIVEDTPRKAKMVNNRFSMPLPPTLAVQSPVSPIPQIEQENSRLLALFAKLQPLRASLDFLPMRLTAFQMRAKSIFPSACDELTRRKEQLEEQERKLEAEAEALREELGEDKWVHSFRQAGSKAVAMYESCMKSIQRLTQAIEDNDEEKLPARIATYTDKKSHYPPSMRRVLELIDIEMKHRSTVNGEILRIQQDVRTKVTDLEMVTKDMDAILTDFTANRKLRDSVSTTHSARTEASSTRETPNSSPASSVVMGRKSGDYSNLRTSVQSRLSGLATPRSSLAPDNRRFSSINMGPAGPSYSVPRAPLNRFELTPSRAGANTPTRNLRIPQTERPSTRPRWSYDVKLRESPARSTLKPLPIAGRVGTPDRLLRTMSAQSSIPIRSPLSRSSALSPQPSAQPKPTKHLPTSPTTPTSKTVTPLRATSAGANKNSVIANGKDNEKRAGEESPIQRRNVRPASVMASRRSSLLPTPTAKSPKVTPAAKTTTPERAGGTAYLGVARRMESIGESRSRAGAASVASERVSSISEKPKWK